MSFTNTWTNYNGRIFIEKKKNEAPPIEVRGIRPIAVREFPEGEKKVFEVSFKEMVPPKIALSVVPSTIEVGQTADIAFKATITKGSEDIKSKSVNPAQEFPEHPTEIAFVVNSVQSMTKGTVANHEFKVTDVAGASASVSGGVKVMNRYYIGVKDVVDGTIEVQGSKLADSIYSAYGSDNEYTLPLGEYHFVWILPAGETLDKVLGPGNFPFELAAGYEATTIKNPYDVDIPCWVYRTKGSYPGEASVKLKCVKV